MSLSLSEKSRISSTTIWKIFPKEERKSSVLCSDKLLDRFLRLKSTTIKVLYKQQINFSKIWSFGALVNCLNKIPLNFKFCPLLSISMLITTKSMGKKTRLFFPLVSTNLMLMIKNTKNGLILWKLEIELIIFSTVMTKDFGCLLKLSKSTTGLWKCLWITNFVRVKFTKNTENCSLISLNYKNTSGDKIWKSEIK